MKIKLLAVFTLLISSSMIAQTITNYTTADGLLHNNVNCVDTDASNNAWFGTQDGVSVFDGTTWTSHTTATDAGLADNTIQAIYIASSGDVWVGTDFGASVYDGLSWTTYTTVDGLGNNQIKCISEDGNGDIWFGTNNGTSKFDGVSTWTSFGTAEGLPFGGVNSIDVHTNGDIWMGTGLSGVYIYDGSVFSSITATEGLIDDRIREMVIDGSNNKWVGTSEGLSVVDANNDVVAQHTTIYTLPAPDTLNPIEDVEMDSQGNIWVGVYVDYLVTEGGVCAYNGSQWVEYHVADGLVGPVVRALAVNNNDEVWVATSTGVSLIADPTLNLDTQENDIQLTVFPNPTKGQVTFSSEKLTDFDVNIYNFVGQQVGSQFSQDNTVSIDLNQLPAGTYLYHVSKDSSLIKTGYISIL